MEKDEIRDIILETIAASLEAQLKAVRRLRDPAVEEESPREKRKSQVEMAYNILESAGKALHISQIIEEIERVFGVALDRESLVSALTKRVLRNDRFVRTGKNTFSLKNE